MRTNRIKSVFSVGALAIMTMAAGCSFHGDTSGFKPEVKPSKAELTQELAKVQANPSMPAGVKAMAINKLQKDIAAAH